jgi:hypothetical protein
MYEIFWIKLITVFHDLFEIRITEIMALHLVIHYLIFLNFISRININEYISVHRIVKYSVSISFSALYVFYNYSILNYWNQNIISRVFLINVNLKFPSKCFFNNSFALIQLESYYLITKTIKNNIFNKSLKYTIFL